MAAPNLVIVESPSKARTLSKFLGENYEVRASMGHVVDLPRSKLGIDVDHEFAPDYTVIRGKEAQLKELKAAARRSKRVLLAADPDREGEAIAWHIASQLQLQSPERIVFREVTKPAVESALLQPRQIDQHLVDAYQARRVIDRLLGYKLSPLLWRKIRKGLSAGRVQSVAVRLVCDREGEIEAFQPQESWTLDALLQTGTGEQLLARYHGPAKPIPERRRKRTEEGEEEGPALANEQQAQELVSALAKAEFAVAGVEKRRVRRNPPQPLITSTLQQDASSQLHFGPARTMRIAQQLYEGVELGDEGPVGLITYMRTDSTRVSPVAAAEAAHFISESFGDSYLGKGNTQRKASPAAVASQDAHEAIRPTDVLRTPDSVQPHLSSDQAKLYRLIWRRFVAAQMSPAEFDSTRVEIHAGEHAFRANGSQLAFDGFLRVAGRDDREEGNLPPVAEGDRLEQLELRPEQHFTQPPARYSEATLIKELEERGIGRPSTYAAEVELIQKRRYVVQQERRLHPTPIGQAVNQALISQFPSVVDFNFTASLEKQLDSIEAGDAPWVPVVRSWYEPFAEVLEKAQEMPRVKVQARPTGESCPRCQAPLVVRSGRYGDFVGCSRYPECDFIEGKEERAAAEQIGEACPQCGKPLVRRTGRRGPFIGCSAYPACRFVRAEEGAAGAEAPARTQQVEPTGESCPECGKPLVRRAGRFGPFVSCSGYPGCRFRPGKTTPVAGEPSAPRPRGRSAAGRKAAVPAKGAAALKSKARTKASPKASPAPKRAAPATASRRKAS